MYEYKRVQGITYTNFFPASNFTRSEVDVEVNMVFVPDHVKKRKVLILAITSHNGILTIPNGFRAF